MRTITSVVLCDEIPVRFAVTTPALVVHEVVNVTGSGAGGRDQVLCRLCLTRILLINYHNFFLALQISSVVYEGFVRL